MPPLPDGSNAGPKVGRYPIEVKAAGLEFLKQVKVACKRELDGHQISKLHHKHMLHLELVNLGCYGPEDSCKDRLFETQDARSCKDQKNRLLRRKMRRSRQHLRVGFIRTVGAVHLGQERCHPVH